MEVVSMVQEERSETRVRPTPSSVTRQLWKRCASGCWGSERCERRMPKRTMNMTGRSAYSKSMDLQQRSGGREEEGEGPGR